MLSLVRSTKNALASINKTPQDVLSLIPNYWEDSDRDNGLIKLTHVCRSWREIFTSRPSLWTRLDCASIEKTKIYIERSKLSPLEICLGRVNGVPCRVPALILAAAHIGRLRTLEVVGKLSAILPLLADHLYYHAPLLEKIDINHVRGQTPTLPNELFSGDLSSLRELCLAGVTTLLPWRGLSNLTTFKFCRVPGDNILSTQLLDFLKYAPHLRHIHFHDSIPNSSNAPAERVVSLPHLKELSIVAQPAHSILLNHLSIPAGASLRLEFTFSGVESPIPLYLPKPPDNLNNISHVNAVNLCFGSEQRSVRLNGPSGELYMLGNWASEADLPSAGTGRFLRSVLNRFDISRSKWLAITRCQYKPRATIPLTEWEPYLFLHSMEELHTLVLSRCHNLHFISTLNPNKNPDKIVLCPKLEEITLYIKRPDQFHINKMLKMAEGRALRGAKLSGITIVSMGALAPPKEVFQLRKHVSRVECRFDDALPAWDALPATQVQLV